MFSQLSPSSSEMLKAEMALGEGLAEAQRQADFDVRRCMNAMKTVGEALKKSQVEGEEGSAERFAVFLTEAQRVARLLLLNWGKNPDDRNNKWMLNAIEKSVMPYVSATPLEDSVVAEMASILKDSAFEWPDTSSYREEASIDVALFRGLNRMSKEYDEFSFYRKNKDADLEYLRDKVVAQALQLMDDLCPDLADHSTRVMFLGMILGELFDVMMVSWRRNAVRAKQALEGKTQAQIKSWRLANPEGFALDPIMEGFEHNAGRLARLTQSVRKTAKKTK